MSGLMYQGIRITKKKAEYLKKSLPACEKLLRRYQEKYFNDYGCPLCFTSAETLGVDDYNTRKCQACPWTILTTDKNSYACEAWGTRESGGKYLGIRAAIQDIKEIREKRIAMLKDWIAFIKSIDRPATFQYGNLTINQEQAVHLKRSLDACKAILNEYENRQLHEPDACPLCITNGFAENNANEGCKTCPWWMFTQYDSTKCPCENYAYKNGSSSIHAYVKNRRGRNNRVKMLRRWIKFIEALP